LYNSNPATPAARINSGSGIFFAPSSANVAVAITTVGTSMSALPRTKAAPLIALTAAAVTPWRDRLAESHGPEAEEVGEEIANGHGRGRLTSH
jgi:hypothetical protein